jgi:hypothetical protein
MHSGKLARAPCQISADLISIPQIDNGANAVGNQSRPAIGGQALKPIGANQRALADRAPIAVGRPPRSRTLKQPAQLRFRSDTISLLPDELFR